MDELEKWKSFDLSNSEICHPREAVAVDSQSVAL